jgi:CHAT domain-containing protein
MSRSFRVAGYRLALCLTALFITPHAHANTNTPLAVKSGLQHSEADPISVTELIQRYSPLFDSRRYEETYPLVKKTFEIIVDRRSWGEYPRVESDYILTLIELGKEEEAVGIFHTHYDRKSGERAMNAVVGTAIGSAISLVPQLGLASAMGVAVSLPGTVLNLLGTAAVNAVFAQQGKSPEQIRFDLLASMASALINQGRYVEAMPFARRLHTEFGDVESTKERANAVRGMIAELLYLSVLSSAGQYSEALQTLERWRWWLFLVHNDTDNSQTHKPGDSYFGASYAAGFNAYWPIKAMLLSRVGKNDELQEIVGTESGLHKYWKGFISADTYARAGDFASADKSLTDIAESIDDAIVSRGLASGQARQYYTHFAMWCGVKLKLLDWKGASTVCARAFEEYTTYVTKIVPRHLPGTGLARQMGWAAYGGIALVDLIPPEWDMPPTLPLATEMARHYAGEPSKFADVLKAVVEREEMRRDVSTIMNDEASKSGRTRNWAYKELIRVYVRSGDSAGAFRLSEQTKARTLFEAASQRDALSANLIPEPERKRLEDYEIGLANLEEKLGDSKLPDAERLKLQAERDAVLRNYRTFKQQLYATHPRFADAVRSREALTDGVDKFFPNDTAFVSYTLHHDDVFVFSIVDGKITALELGRYSGLLADVGEFREHLGDPSSAGNKSPMEEKLSRFLLGSLPTEVFSKKRLVFSLDGVLSQVPFEVLTHGTEPLIASHDLSYVQSLSMLSVLQKRQLAYAKLTGRKSLLAMGDPVFSDTTKDSAPIAASAPRTERGTSKRTFRISTEANSVDGRTDDRKSTNRALSLAGIALDGLPATRIEVNTIAKGFPGSATYLGKDASEQTLQTLRDQKKLSGFKYLHFATHGYINPLNPSLSAIILDQTNRNATIDGFVTTAEWQNYELRSDLVTLSACETGLGKFVEGEGVMGLPYALFMAGNVNTVMTLWSVADESTGEFMISFYEKLRSGIPYSAALSAVKREFLKREGMSTPFFWAPFVLYGV